MQARSIGSAVRKRQHVVTFGVRHPGKSSVVLGAHLQLRVLNQRRTRFDQSTRGGRVAA